MNYNKLFLAQAELDNTIIGDKQIDNLKFKKVEALLCEIQETANATKCFKYWSQKKSDLDDVLEETADILHFLLSIGNDLAIDSSTVEEQPVSAYDDITEQFIVLTYTASCIAMYSDKKRYYLETIKLFNGLVFLLEFTDEELEKAYYSKLEENYRRQASGY